MNVEATSETGYRLYSEKCLETLSLIEFYKHKNLPLNIIKIKIQEMNRINNISCLKKLESILKQFEDWEVEVRQLQQIAENPTTKEKIEVSILEINRKINSLREYL